MGKHLSQRKYAEHRGVSHTAVAKAIATGRIQLEPDKKIDVEKADASWQASTDPAKQRGHQAGLPETPGAPRKAPAPEVELDEETLAMIDAIEIADLGDEVDDPTAPPGSAGKKQGQTFLRIRMAREQLGLQQDRLKLDTMAGKLIDRQKTIDAVFELGRQLRDALENWPSRISANMAADLAVDQHLMEQTLKRYITAHLKEISNVQAHL